MKPSYGPGGSIWSRQQWTCKPDDRQVSTASGTLRQTRTAIEFLFSVDCPWVEQPTRPSRIAFSVETFRAQLAQEIGIAVMTSRSHYYYDWDDCWPPVPHIPCGSFAQNRFRFKIPAFEYWKVCDVGTVGQISDCQPEGIGVQSLAWSRVLILGNLLSPHHPWTGTLSRWSSLSMFYRGT